MKIGLFFGTFNPVHLGHTEVVSRVLNENIFNELWVVLTPRSPHKNFTIVKKKNRLEMLKIAFKNYEKVIISDIEFKLKQPNYTIDTLSYLSDKFPKHTFSIIMGSDNYLNINTWKKSNKIIEKYPIYIYPRGEFSVKNKMNSKNVYYLNFPKVRVSSTGIRFGISSKNKEIEQYLSSAVHEYIKTHQLY